MRSVPLPGKSASLFLADRVSPLPPSPALRGMSGRHLPADPLVLLTVVLQCRLPVGWAAKRQDERCREGGISYSPQETGALTVPRARARRVGKVGAVPCFPGPVSHAGAGCRGAVAVVTALRALTAKAAQKRGMFLLAFPRV